MNVLKAIIELQTELQSIKSKLGQLQTGLQVMESKLDRYVWQNDFNDGLKKLHQLLKEIDEKLKPDKLHAKKITLDRK
jgi:hypothetical protein